MKTYAVIGLGKFGFFVAKKLIDEGIDIIAIDNKQDKIQNISEYTENAIILDSTDIRSLREAGIVNLDTVVVSIGDNIEASILTVMALKDLGNKTVIAKAINQIHGEILSKIGAFKVIFPEKLAGRKLVRDIVGNLTFDKIEFSNSIKILKILVTKTLIGKSVKNIEALKSNIKVIGYKSDGCWTLNIDESYILTDGDMIAFIGKVEEIEKFSEII